MPHVQGFIEKGRCIEHHVDGVSILQTWYYCVGFLFYLILSFLALSRRVRCTEYRLPSFTTILLSIDLFLDAKGAVRGKAVRHKTDPCNIYTAGSKAKILQSREFPKTRNTKTPRRRDAVVTWRWCVYGVLYICTS